MKKLFLLVITALSSLLIIIGCGSSTSSRYEKSDRTTGTDSTVFNYPENNKIKVNEDFDITPYKTKLEIATQQRNSTTEQNDVWFDYDLINQQDQPKKLIGTDEGYRVLVVSSDNLEEVDKIKTDIQSYIDGNEIYTVFEPPFYKLKIGDFRNQNSADNLRFKLNQLGYKDAKVVREIINIFQ